MREILAMEKVYSKIDPEKLIISTIKKEEITEYRSDISPAKEYLQVSARKIRKGVKVKAHRHIEVNRKSDITQEAWIVLSGSIKGVFYDLDGSFLTELTLQEGDVVVLFRGGHSLEVLEDNTVFYELKTGPYMGQENDKEDI